MSSAAASPPWAGAPSVAGGPDRVSLIDADDAIWSAVPAPERPLARRALTADRYELPRGRWTPTPCDGERPFAALLVTGALLQEVLLARRTSAQVLGPGALVRPWREAPTELPCTMAWTVLTDATVAVLDARFLMAARRWPDLMTVVHDRLSDQLDTAARRAALYGLPRVEDRIVALFWQLADVWGVVRPDGIAIRLPFTHDLIGRMIGAKRSTVSLALGVLAAEGRLWRSTDDTWTLSPLSRTALGATAPAVPGMDGAAASVAVRLTR